ncbi:ABC transporter ATP-binding protein [Natronoflexus pectinivorans]|uniref:ABC-2 type transport system ATP-binding protein n=1 Tax=Natronoflexus pectinivorans TaxID=682526 RepID=A0A4R2GHV6_9BACT|nr:ABC transporter ATP-binding protein [Natronoflexus pectinivorans]TCO08028.1 ABC-2 type transport system ATP-binding protein [Natronoflexus pectinivorans]
MIEIINLKKQYHSEVVLNIDNLQIQTGECFGLVGNNGAGKTTLFRLILDMIKATAGSVTINGENVSLGEEWKKRTGAYLDEYMLLGYLTPDEYFEVLRKFYRLSKEDVRIHLDRFFDFFNGEITGTSKYIRDLSKGNIKKTGLAAALFGNPGLVLLDEPFENLDPTSQTRLKRIIRREQEEFGRTFLISSHDLNHVTEICSRIVLLEKGLVIKDMKSDEQMAVELENYFNQ